MPRNLKEKYKKILQKQKIAVSAEDVVQIKEEAEAAKRLLEAPEFQFFREYLRNTQKSIVDLFINNRIKLVRDSTTDDVGVTREFETTKQEQLDEMSGQYKLIDAIFHDLISFSELPKELDKAKSTGSVEETDSSEG